MPLNSKDEYVSDKPATEPAKEQKTKQSTTSDVLVEGIENIRSGVSQEIKGLSQVVSSLVSLTYVALSDLYKQSQEENDKTIDLNKEVLHFLSDHCVKQFNVSKETAERHLKSVINGDGTLKNTPLENLLRIELAITKDEKNGEQPLCYKLILLVVKDGQAVRQTISLPLNGLWDYAPADLRKKFIEQNKDELLFLVYTV